MNIATVEGLLLLLAFVVPGFVIHQLRNVLSPRPSDPPHAALPRYLMLSVVNASIWIWTLPAWPPAVDALSEVSPWHWILMSLLGPAALGLMYGFVLAKELPRAALGWLRIRGPWDAHSAWNYKFSGEARGFVIVHLRSGELVHGFFGPRSMAASTLDHGDLYLEKVFAVDAEGMWSVTPDQRGVLLMRDSIQVIEFFSTGNDYGQR